MTRALRRWWRASTALTLCLPLWLARRLRRVAQVRLDAAKAGLAALPPISPKGWHVALAERAAARAQVDVAEARVLAAVEREDWLIRRVRAASEAGA